MASLAHIHPFASASREHKQASCDHVWQNPYDFLAEPGNPAFEQCRRADALTHNERGDDAND
jgi:hypothetical protein